MKEYLTARDIEDLVARGVREIPMTDDIIFTDLARDRAVALGVTLLRTPEQAPLQVTPVPHASTPPTSVDPHYRRAAISLPLKPRGCLHSYLETGNLLPSSSMPGTADASSNSPSLVERLVEALRRLGR